MYLTYLVLLGVVIICNSILLVVFYLRTQRNITTISLFLLLLFVNVWFIPKFLTNMFEPSGFLFETLSRIAAPGYIFVPVVLLIFCLSYASYNHVFHKLYFWILLLVLPVVFLYLSWTSHLVGVHDAEAARVYAWGFETPTGVLWPYYIGWYVAMILLSIGVLFYHYHSMADQSKKRQTLFFIVAITVPLVVNIFTAGILPVLGVFVFPFGLILLDVMTILGISLIYHTGWFEVSSFLILSQISQVILTVDTKGHIIQANSFAEKVFKKKAGEFMGKPLDTLLYIRHKDRENSNHCLQLLHLALARGKNITFHSFSVYVGRKNKLTETFSISPIYSQAAIIGANIFLQDTKREEDIARQKNDYFAMVFHELKTPIASIKAYNQLLLTRLQDKAVENKMFILKIDEQLNRLTRLINDFYELSRLQTGKLALKKEYFDINDLIRSVIDMIRITQKNRAFHLEGHADARVYADRDKIEQILINFINNAIKYSPEDKEIIIHLSTVDRKVIIGVEDHGKGIDPKFHKKVFNRFFQIGNISKERKGLGVGLFIARSIVKAHGGRIWLNSKLGKGSTFYFSLPVIKA